MATARETLARVRSGNGAPSLGRSAARGAAVGALVSIPVPGVGLVAGALLGAGIALVDRLSKD